MPTKEELQEIMDRYPVGCRVELLEMADATAPPPGTQGTVTGCDSIGSVMVDWGITAQGLTPCI